jgi:hypothetical protein
MSSRAMGLQTGNTVSDSKKWGGGGEIQKSGESTDLHLHCVQTVHEGSTRTDLPDSLFLASLSCFQYEHYLAAV